MGEVHQLVRMLTPGAQAAGVWDAEEVVCKIRWIDDEVRRPLGLPEAEEDDGKAPVTDTSHYNMPVVFDSLNEDVLDLLEMCGGWDEQANDFKPGAAEQHGRIMNLIADALGVPRK
jgi:hypothetical protein